MVYAFKDGQIIVDRIRPRDHLEMTARLWGAFGRGSIRATMRRMESGEQFVEMPEIVEVS